MFKSITVFHILAHANKRLLSPESLQEALPSPTIIDPGKTAWASFGVSRPGCFGEETVFIGADNTRVLNVQYRERVLPARVIAKHLNERIAEIENRQGSKVSRKERMSIKDDVIVSLLPTAFVKPTDILCMITGNYLIVGTGSARMVETCLVLINSLFDGKLIELRNIVAGRNPRPWLYDLLDTGTTSSELFNCGESVVLRSTDKSTARFKDMDLDKQSVRDALLAGMFPVEIAATYDDSVQFAMNDQMVIKRIKFSDVLLKQVTEDNQDGDVGQFDGTVALVSGTLTALLDNLTTEIPVERNADEEEL